MIPSSATTNTAQPSGVVQLITPMQVVTNLTSGSNAKIALFGFLTVHFIPEPGMLSAARLGRCRPGPARPTPHEEVVQVRTLRV